MKHLEEVRKIVERMGDRQRESEKNGFCMCSIICGATHCDVCMKPIDGDAYEERLMTQQIELDIRQWLFENYGSENHQSYPIQTATGSKVLELLKIICNLRETIIRERNRRK